MVVRTQTSDQFFANLSKAVLFDVIFVDGLHTAEQTYRDLMNSLNHLSNSGVILLDDVWPNDVWSALPDQSEALRLRRQAGSSDLSWHGDVFKVMLAVQEEHKELEFLIVGENSPTDNTQALIWRKPGTPRQTYDPTNLVKLALHRHATFEETFEEGNPKFQRADEAFALSRVLDVLQD